MHLDFANLLNLVSTVTLIGALVFTGLQVRAANRARRDQAAVTVIETAALSENSARFLELLSEIPDAASATMIENLDADTRRQIFLFGLRVEVIGYMVFHGLVDVQTVNDLAGGAILSFWSRAKNWSEERRKPRRVFGVVRMARDTNRAVSRHATLCSGVFSGPGWTGMNRGFPSAAQPQPRFNHE
jgi:hypothetical protein